MWGGASEQDGADATEARWLHRDHRRDIRRRSVDDAQGTATAKSSWPHRCPVHRNRRSGNRRNQTSRTLPVVSELRSAASGRPRLPQRLPKEPGAVSPWIGTVPGSLGPLHGKRGRPHLTADKWLPFPPGVDEERAVGIMPMISAPEILMQSMLQRLYRNLCIP